MRVPRWSSCPEQQGNFAKLAGAALISWALHWGVFLVYLYLSRFFSLSLVYLYLSRLFFVPRLLGFIFTDE